MAFTPPNSFVASTTLEAAPLLENFDALKNYLQGGVVAGDLTASQWVQTKHVQPPMFEPFTNIQHGVTGIQGGQWAGGAETRLSFVTSYLTGQGFTSGGTQWSGIPNSSFRLPIRRQARIAFHWWVELEAGPDDVPYVAGLNYPVDDRLAYVCPFIGTPKHTSTYLRHAQTTQNSQYGFASASPYGSLYAYTIAGSWGQRDGTLITSTGPGELVIGLAQYSQIDRAALVTWGVSVEVFYV